MSTPSNWKITEDDQEKLDVLKHQASQLDHIGERADDLLSLSDHPVSQSESLLRKYQKALPVSSPRTDVMATPGRPGLRTWDEIVAEARVNIDGPAVIEDLFTAEEIQLACQRTDALRGEFNERHRLDAAEWSICGVAGVLSALVDVFLIWMPKHPGFLGGKSSKGGPLANWIRERVNRSFTPEEIRRLEQKNPVSFDFSTSRELKQHVDGLGPTTHRFQSLGHDPILGWLFGVKDTLAETFTAIDKHGHLIVQHVDFDAASRVAGLFEAIGRQFGHLKSDVATSAGLPAPLMPLLQFFQVGSFGKHGHTIGEVSRIMYRSGYDFRHFLAMSIAPLLVEILVRLSYFAKRQIDGASFGESVPFDYLGGERKPKLRTMLFAAHLIAAAANAGKVAIGQNPLLLNWAQWLAFARYAFPQLKWAVYGKELERHRFVQAALDERWNDVYDCLNATWDQVLPDPVLIA